MRNVLQRRERYSREPLADALSHLCTGYGVEHSPDEAQWDVGFLEHRGPALGVLAAVLDVADQEMRIPPSVVQVEALPDGGGVSRRVVPVRERRRERCHEQLPVHSGAYLRPLLRIEQGLLNRLWAVHVGVDAAVHEVDRTQVNRERAGRTPR